MAASTQTATILMSVHNGMPFVQDAVRSILDQTHKDFEFLILDDASTDGTADYLRKLKDPRVRVVPLATNIGLTAALNAGLREARGDFIVRQDADDLSHPSRIAAQLAFLHANPKCAAVGSQALLVEGNERSLGKKEFPLSHEGIVFAHLFDNALAHSAVTFRKSAVLAVGGYDEAWPASQDYELWSRLSGHHELANLPARLATLRVLDSSITRQHKRPELIRRVQAAHYRRLFGHDASETALDLIGLVRTRVAPARLREFRVLVEEMTAAFEAAHPGSLAAPDFRRNLSMLHERVGYNILQLSRFSGLAEIFRAVRTAPSRIFSMPWIRIAALAVLGDSARRLYERATK